jgi:hypothetical protein
MKARGQPLFDGELIEGHVAIERADNPVAIWPNLPHLVIGKSSRVGIARQIEPILGAPLGIGGRLHQPIDDSLVGTFLGVAKKCLEHRAGNRLPDSAGQDHDRQSSSWKELLCGYPAKVAKLWLHSLPVFPHDSRFSLVALCRLESFGRA